MAILSDELKYNLKLSWFNIVQALYGFPPIQRIVLVFGIIFIIPAYFLTRYAANAYYSNSYEKILITAHPSFSNPEQLTFAPVKIIPLASNAYVAYTKVTNPNLALSAYSATFNIVFSNAKGEQVYTYTGRTYLGRGESKYIVVPRFVIPDTVKSAQVEVTGDTHWQNRLDIPQVRISATEPLVKNSATGVLIQGAVLNDSAYTLGAVQLAILIYTQEGIIGVTERTEYTLKPQERRAYVQAWPGLEAGEVTKVEVLPSTNVYDSRNLQIDTTDLPGRGTGLEE